jgi:hypothetical protein
VALQSVVEAGRKIRKANTEGTQPGSQLHDVKSSHPAFALADESLMGVKRFGQLLLRHADAFTRLPQFRQEMLVFV